MTSSEPNNRQKLVPASSGRVQVDTAQFTNAIAITPLQNKPAHAPNVRLSAGIFGEKHGTQTLPSRRSLRRLVRGQRWRSHPRIPSIRSIQAPGTLGVHRFASQRWKSRSSKAYSHLGGCGWVDSRWGTTRRVVARAARPHRKAGPSLDPTHELLEVAVTPVDGFPTPRDRLR